MTDTHSPSEYSVHRILRNIAEFYRAYNVQPATRCTWLLSGA
jgi:predicted metalloendopeptidase